VLGTGLAKFVYGVSGFTGGGFFPSFLVTWGTIGRALGIAGAMGFLSGAIPAWNASRLKVVDALRHVG
jgi:putative ABC transport system permease protein